MIELVFHKALSRQIAAGRFRVIYPSGRTEDYGDGSGKPVTLRFADPEALRAVARDPGLAMPEMYMDGRLTLDEGDPYSLIALVKSNTLPEHVTGGASARHYLRRITAAPILRTIGPKLARLNVAHHYDLDERLYRLFLDEDMQYSCAYFPRPDLTLDQAQLAKKRLIAAKLLVRPGARVLDIGCGWGGLALYLAQVCGARVTGITLSTEQQRVARERANSLGLADRVDFRLQDYREIEGPFDNIVSVGMFEHVGLRQFPTYFAAAARLLRRDGVMLLHSIGQPTAGNYNQPFIEKYIFPGGYIPALSEVTSAIRSSGLLVRDIEILPLHYAETLRAWRERFLARRADVMRIYDERFVRMWEVYLAGSEAAFRYDSFHVFHAQLVHDQARVPLDRSYIAAEMARLEDIERAVPAYAHLLKGQPPQAMLRCGTS